MIQRAIKGESFILEFDAYNPKDRTQAVTSGTFEVEVDGRRVDGGMLSVDGNELSFRFIADNVGTNIITISYVFGSDIWKDRYRIVVEP